MLDKPASSDGVLKYSTRTRVQLEYNFGSTRTRNPRYSVGTCTRKPMYLVLGQKKEPSARVLLAFAKSNKQYEFLIVNCCQ